jgi:hypothetical protein
MPAGNSSSGQPCHVIDLLTLALTHGLMALAAITLLSRADLDDENGGSAQPKPWQRKPGNPDPTGES